MNPANDEAYRLMHARMEAMMQQNPNPPARADASAAIADPPTEEGLRALLRRQQRELIALQRRHRDEEQRLREAMAARTRSNAVSSIEFFRQQYNEKR